MFSDAIYVKMLFREKIKLKIHVLCFLWWICFKKKFTNTTPNPKICTFVLYCLKKITVINEEFSGKEKIIKKKAGNDGFNGHESTLFSILAFSNALRDMRPPSSLVDSGKSVQTFLTGRSQWPLSWKCSAGVASSLSFFISTGGAEPRHIL